MMAPATNPSRRNLDTSASIELIIYRVLTMKNESLILQKFAKPRRYSLEWTLHILLWCFLLRPRCRDANDIQTIPYLTANLNRMSALESSYDAAVAFASCAGRHRNRAQGLNALVLVVRHQMSMPSSLSNILFWFQLFRTTTDGTHDRRRNFEK